MTTHLLKANPAVTEDRGRVAFQRGPVVYCMERLDQDNHEHDFDLTSYTVQLNGSTSSHFDASLLDGVIVLSHPGSVSNLPAETGLYYPAAEAANPQVMPTTLRLIPYYAWSNRAPAAMQVWIPYSQA
jgi:DUF1680 family protein